MTSAGPGVVLVEVSRTPWGDGRPGSQEPDQGSSGDSSLSKPPLGWLGAAAAVAISSLVLWLPATLALHGVGYVLSTFVTLGLLAVAKRRDLRARQSAFYSPRSQLTPVSVGVTVLAVLGAMAHVWVLASYWAA